jgi:hypothetical protein
MPRNVTLPDGRTIVIPDDATPDQLAALRNKLSSQFANLTTGEGMEARANQQAGLSLLQPTNDDAEFARTINLKPTDIAGVTDAAMLGTGGAGIARTIAEQGLKAAAAPIIRGVVGAAAGSAAGGYGGREIGDIFGQPKLGGQIGATVGGVAGGLGAMPRGGSLLDLLKGPAAAEAEAPEVVSLSKSPNANQYDAVRAGQRAALRREAVGGVGSQSQEAGWSPAVTKVPFPREGGAPVTVESIPGPDTSGRGNLLTPAAKRGVAGAGDELVRRGRTLIYTPPDFPQDAITPKQLQTLQDLQKFLAGTDQ